MDKEWAERLTLWWEHTEGKLKKKWWLWPVFFLVETLWHTVYAKASEFLQEHGPPFLTVLVTHIPTDPLTLTVVTSAGIVLALAIHAYFDTRKPNAKVIGKLTVTPAKIASPEQKGEALPYGAELRSQFQLLEKISEKEKKIKDLTGELDRLIKQQATTDERLKRVWILKEAAREIRRYWPDADFNRRPAYKRSWLPPPGKSEDWLSTALEWYDLLMSKPTEPTISHFHLASLDFEELIEYFDLAEQIIRGKPVRPIQVGDGEAPVVRLTEWVTEHSEFSSGFMMINDGRPASYISTEAATFPSDTMEAQPFDSLFKEHGPTLLRAGIFNTKRGLRRSETDINYIDGFARLINAMPRNKNGEAIPIQLRVIFSDQKQNRYVSRHQLTASGKTVSVVYVNSERLSMDYPGIPGNG